MKYYVSYVIERVAYNAHGNMTIDADIKTEDDIMELRHIIQELTGNAPLESIKVLGMFELDDSTGSVQG